jgi:hypothetical protein
MESLQHVHRPPTASAGDRIYPPETWPFASTTGKRWSSADCWSPTGSRIRGAETSRKIRRYALRESLTGTDLASDLQWCSRGIPACSCIEWQSDVLFGKRGLRGLRAAQMVELVLIAARVEPVLIGEHVQKFREPPREAFGSPDAT